MSYFGIDIGGTKIKAVLLRNRGKFKPDLFAADTPKTKKRFLEELERFVRLTTRGEKIKGVGVCLPGIVEQKRGILVKAPNVPFLNGWNAKKFFKRFGVKVAIENDSRCFLMAEFLFGAAKGYKNVVGIAIGTGIGGGIIIDGEIYRGSRNGAGEFGHSIINVFSKTEKSFENLAGKKAFLKYGDRSEIIGIGVANIVNFFDPDAVVLGGGGVISGAVKLEAVKNTARKHIMSPLSRGVPIIKGKLGGAASAIGAALFNA